jgi:hypothetical protein
LAHAARARAKPTFDAEERDVKVRVAAQLRAALASANGSGEWEPAVRAAFQEGLLADMTVRAHRDWFKEWAAADSEALGAALGAFMSEGASAEERFGAFARAAASYEQGEGADAPPAAVLALGSLFNFATDPQALPLMREWHFTELERILGFEVPPGLDDGYPAHLAFAERVRARLEESGLDVRDMIDVQSLIFIAALEQPFWTGNEPCPIGAPAPRVNSEGASPESYLAICAVYRNEAPYLREWIEFHRLAGVEHFFLYDNRSTDDHREMLAPYLEDRIVTLTDWDVELLDQRDTFDHCLREHGDRSRWIAFIDLDEFLFSPTGRPLPEVLTEYEGWPGVGVNWAVFGTAGHETRPSGLVIENYLMRVDHPANRFIKSIVDPSRAVRCINVHDFEYESLMTIDENHYPIHGVRSKSVSFSRLRINHYLTKSKEEARTKVDRPEEWQDHRRWRAGGVEEGFPQEEDRTVLAHAAAVREALSRTGARS